LRRGRRIAVIVLLIVLIIALLFVVYQLFLVRGIFVTGNVSEEYVISLSGIEQNQSVFFINEETALEKIDAEPWLKAVEVKVKYPDKVFITAEQREIAAYVDKGDDYLAIDSEGVLLRVVPKSQVSLPVVYGLQMDKFEVGKTLGALDTFVLGVVQRLLVQLGESDLNIASIDVSLAANIVFATHDGIKIEIGDDTQLAAKFELAVNSLLWLDEKEKTGGILDVSAVTSAYYREN
jgi:cell division protein FtsQ